MRESLLLATLLFAGLGCGSTRGTGDGGSGGDGSGGGRDMAVGPPATRDVVDNSLPGNLPMQFDGATATMGGITLVYPNPGAVIPHDLAQIEPQWNGTGQNAYRVTFAVDTGDKLRGYVPQPKWLPTQGDWQWLLDRARGRTITLDVEGGVLDNSGQLSMVVASSSQTLRVSTDDATGALFYFATTGDQTTGDGTLERLEVGGQAPAKYLNKSNDGGRCVGCHAIARDGSKLAYTFLDLSLPVALTLGEANAPDPTMQLAAAGTDIAQSTFNPDGTKLLTSFQGVLTLRDGTNGTKIADVATQGPALYPDWSPDGKKVVFTRPRALCQVTLGLDFGQASIFVYGGSIVTLDYANGAFTNEQVLLAAAGSDNDYYPSFSPDGSYIAFTRSDGVTGSSWGLANTACNGEAGAGVSYDNPSATVWLIAASGGAPIQLLAANGTGMKTNSWPKWGPKPDGQYLWLSFTTTRDYGNELAGAGALHQLWITAIARPGEASGNDPSQPPVWFPFQDMATKNHIGEWGLKVGDYMIM